MSLRRLCLPALFIFLFAGCGKGSESGRIFSPYSGHPVEWANPLFIGRDNFHGTAIKQPLPGPPGSELFLLHCAPCHGEKGEGKIGRNIQGMPLAAIEVAIISVPLMSGHSILTETELQEISDYLSVLAGNAQPASALIETDLCLQCHGNDLDGGIARVSCFSCHKGPGGDIGHPAGWQTAKEDPAHFHGRYGGVFVASCTNCHGEDLSGYVAPACSSCHDGNKAPLLPPFSLLN